MEFQEKYRLSFDGQVNAAISNECPYTVFEMKHDIDVKAFECAVNKAAEYHPVFKMKLMKETGLYYLVPNSAPAKVAVSGRNTDITYGTPEYNNYGMLYSPKASIVYTHLTKLGLDAEVEAHIEDVYVSGAARPSPLIVAMARTFRDEISITIGQSIKNDALIEAIRTVLDELNVVYELSTPERLPAIHYLK